jgi:hypothetical protein
VSEADKADEKEGNGTKADPPPPPPSRRAQKKQRRKEERERLSKWSFFQEHSPGDAIKLIFSGDAIGPESGDGVAIGTMIVRAAHLLSSLGAKPQLATLTFAKSVTVEFRAPQAEIIRAEDKLETARVLAEALGEEPAPEQEDEIRLTLGEAVTDLVVASELAADLLSAPSTEAPETAVSLGSDVAEAYRTLANAVSKAQLTFIIEPPENDPGELTPAKAIRVAEQLKAASEPLEVSVVAFGILSIANQEQRGFGLKLDLEVRRHALLKGKRVVHGTYIPPVEAKIRDEGLWGREVRATLRVVRDALVSTSTIRPPSYTLIDVEPWHRG